MEHRPIIVSPEYLRLLAEGMEKAELASLQTDDFGFFIECMRIANEDDEEFMLRFMKCETKMVLESEPNAGR